MSRSKKFVYKDIRASTGEKDYFGTLFDGMCRSEAYKALNIGAKQFYSYCRVQAKSTHGRQCLYNHGKRFEREYTEYDFVFPASHLEMYGIKGSNANKYFNQLIKAGFIEIKEKNNLQHKINVYSFSDKWKDGK